LSLPPPPFGNPLEPPINIPDEYLIRIGRITVAWGALETVVDLALAKLAGFAQYDPRSAIITAHMTWPLKMDILESLAHALATKYPELRRLPKAKPFLAAAQSGRNRASHGHWVYTDGKVRKLRYTARGQLKASADFISEGEFDEIVLAITNAGRAVLDVVFDCGGMAGAVVPDEKV